MNSKKDTPKHAELSTSGAGEKIIGPNEIEVEVDLTSNSSEGSLSDSDLSDEDENDADKVEEKAKANILIGSLGLDKDSD